MALATGSTLQNGKYFIQKVLHQSDFGLTYQAMHTYLEQTVIVQSYNDSLQSHDRFDYLRQLFMEEVRRRVHRKSPSSDQPSDKSSDNSPVLTILDGFEEDGLPYIVMQQTPGQTLPQLRDWLPLTKIIMASPSHHESPDMQHGTFDELAALQTPTPDPVAIEHSPEQAHDRSAHTDLLNGQGNGSTVGSTGAPPAITEPPSVGAPGWTPPPQVIHQPVQSSTIFNERPDLAGQGQPSRAIAVAAKPRKGRWVLPVALLTVASLGGVAGASLGWILRFQPVAATTSGESIQPPILNLGNDQSFPPTEDWPISEADDFTPTGGGAWREPVSIPDRSPRLNIPEPEPEIVPDFPQENLQEGLFDKAPEEPASPDSDESITPPGDDKISPFPSPAPAPLEPSPAAPESAPLPDPVPLTPPDASGSLPIPAPSSPSALSAEDFPEPTMQ
jgi:hypothetical protein